MNYLDTRVNLTWRILLLKCISNINNKIIIYTYFQSTNINKIHRGLVGLDDFKSIRYDLLCTKTKKNN